MHKIQCIKKGSRFHFNRINGTFFLFVTENRNYKIKVFQWDEMNKVFVNNMLPIQSIIPNNGSRVKVNDMTSFKVINFI